MKMVSDDEAASSTQRTITARDMDRPGDSTSWFPSWWRLCLLTVLEITWAYRYLGGRCPVSDSSLIR